MKKYSTSSSPAELVKWADDLLVFQNTESTVIQSSKDIPRFIDDYWDLSGLQWKATISKKSINFNNYPVKWKDSAKMIAWCMLNLEAPIKKLQRPNAARTRPSKSTVVANMESEVRPFFLWLANRRLNSLADVTEKQLEKYGDEVSRSNLSRNYKGRRLWGPTRLWLYSEFLPKKDCLTRPPWERDGTLELLGPAKWSPENLTDPIHPSTMSPLLIWAQMFVNDFSDEIIQAVQVKNELRPNLRSYSKTGEREQLIKFLDQFYLNRKGLPGHIGPPNQKLNIASQYLSVFVGVGTNCVRGEVQKRIMNGQEIIEAAPLSENRSIKINDVKIIPFIDYYYIGKLKILLSTACLIIIAYLSGMRIEECRGLQRGCCRKVTNKDGSVRYEIWAKSYKDAIDFDGNTIPGGKIRDEPWHVIEPVDKSIRVMEEIHSDEYLFSAIALQSSVWEKTKNSKRAPMELVVIQKNIEYFISWCNGVCRDFEFDDMSIPDDPDGHITTKRFRRTLAWFIHRLPAGRISLGIQYGHMQGLTSDGYGSRVSSGLRDLFPMEEALARAETLSTAEDMLCSGERVSGPAAGRYRKGVSEFSVRFQGKSLSSRQLAELKRDPVFKIYDNGMQPLACCYDSSKALCHSSRENSWDGATTPNLSRCNDKCPNIARTDSHIVEISKLVKWQLLQSKSELVPEPLRLRHRKRADTLNKIIKKHKKAVKCREEANG